MSPVNRDNVKKSIVKWRSFCYNVFNLSYFEELYLSGGYPMNEQYNTRRFPRGAERSPRPQENVEENENQLEGRNAIAEATASGSGLPYISIARESLSWIIDCSLKTFRTVSSFLARSHSMRFMDAPQVNPSAAADVQWYFMTLSTLAT